MKKFGIDISKWQKGFNFDKAKAEGVEFIILRGAYSITKDICFEDFYSKCKAKGIPVGVYHYSMARTVKQAKEEANLMINLLKGKKLEYPIFLDVEDNVQKKLGKNKLTSIIKTYCKALEDAGYYVGIYSTYSYLSSYANIKELSDFDFWVAQWNKSNTCSIPYGMWQFGGETNYIRSNKIAGVVCDQDYAYKDYPAIMKKAGLNGYRKEGTAKTVDEIAQEVIAGKWGNGAERKVKLADAGYSYEKVQAKVNELLTPKKKKGIFSIFKK